MKSMASRIDHTGTGTGTGTGTRAAAAGSASRNAQRPLAVGRALDAPLRADMGRRFGHDFAQVRIHTGAGAAASASSMGALAYTVGTDIAFAAGRYQPASAAGRRLLAHELAHVVQQRGSAPHPQAKLAMSTAGDASERFADAAADAVMGGHALPVQPRTGLQLARQVTSATPTAAPARRIDASAATVSWIDPTSPAGARVPDPAPPAVVTSAFLTGNTGFRFSNYLHAWCESPDGVHLSGNDFYPDSAMYRGPSYLGIPSHAHPTQQSRTPFNEGGVEGIDFLQVAGARTISAGVIGGTVGGAVGVGGGIALGAKGGAMIGAFGGPIGAGAGAVIGGLVGGLTGFFVGNAAANRVTNFPPIWTRLKLRIKADGSRSTQLLAHSYFPSNNHYLDLTQVRAYSALAAEQTSWENSGWDSGNPWGISRPLVTP